MTDFDLRAAIRSVLDETNLTSPAEVAAKVAENVPTRLRLAVLTQALTTVVRIEMSHGRPGTAGPPPRPAANSNRSAKVRAIREDWERRLRDRVHIGAKAYAMVQDLSYENVLFLAQERRHIAAKTAASAAWWDEAGQEMTTHGVDRFGDLPREVLARLLSREAAAA